MMACTLAPQMGEGHFQKDPQKLSRARQRSQRGFGLKKAGAGGGSD